jgi:putative phosphoribosyl transferase
VYISPGELRDIERTERAELEARVARFRGDAPPVSLEGRTAVIVDDGVATGATARVAAVVAKARGAVRVVLATPVGASDSLGSLAADPAVDEIVCLSMPPGFMSVGMHYRDFAQTTDAQVSELLAAARAGE